MLKRYGSYAKPPILLVHGGAGAYKDNHRILGTPYLILEIPIFLGTTTQAILDMAKS